MTAATFDINVTFPLQIFRDGRPKPFTVMNSDTHNAVWLTDLPGNNGFPLSPGSSIVWDANKGLYAYVEDVTAPVRVVTLDNQGAISNVGALAQQIIDAGLAGEIAFAITSSPLAGQIGKAVPVPPSAAAIGAAVPRPPSAADIGAALGSSAPVPPSAAAIAAAIAATTVNATLEPGLDWGTVGTTVNGGNFSAWQVTIGPGDNKQTRPPLVAGRAMFAVSFDMPITSGRVGVDLRDDDSDMPLASFVADGMPRIQWAPVYIPQRKLRFVAFSDTVNQVTCNPSVSLTFLT